uniref:Ig-like domain-containing protein n=1 Tax=Panagrellus redivivus TaxID=6233 RepID=A0A7E4VQ73_PANRE
MPQGHSPPEVRPVFFSNGSIRLDSADSEDPFAVTASSVKFSEGDTAILHCPVYGYPQPTIEWFKDGEELDWDSGRTKKRDPDLYISDVTRADDGLYRCRATNKFPVSRDSQESTEFSGYLDQSLRVTNHLAWIIPLVVIIVILILLFTIIYCCSYCKRRSRNQYNVAEKERTLRDAEAQKLNAPLDDDE